MTIVAGTRLGRYEIRSKIGAGGMGEVYLAQDTELERTVALKALPAEVAGDQQRMNRFVQEAKAASALNHPNILTVYEIVQTASTHFIATEYIEGETLRHHLSNAGMKLNEVLDISIQVTNALAAAHKAGIIHRDMKPENIMIRWDGIVKVLDFGLAKLTAHESTDVDTEARTKTILKTDPGTVVGTATYMSPEQARGIPLDARTDIFSMGVVLYEMVAGCLPFTGSTSGEVLAAILSEKQPQPLARYSREVPAELERVVSKALRKNRDERYQTIKDFVLDLKSLKQELEFAAKLEHSTPPELRGAGGAAKPVDGREVSTEPGEAAVQTAVEGTRATSSADYIVSRIKRHRGGALLALAALVAVAAAVAYFAYSRYTGGVGAGAIRSIAVLPFTNADGNPDAEYLSDGISESLINSLSQLPGVKVIARSSSFRYKGKEIDPQEVANALGVEAILTGRVVQRGDNLLISAELVNASDKTHVWGEQYNRKLSDILAVQEEIANEITRKLQLRLSGEEKKLLTKRYTENMDAYQLYLQGRYFQNKRTEEGLKRSLEYFEQAIGKDANYALAYSGLADSYSYLGNHGFVPPKEASPRAKDAAVKALELDETLAEAHTALAYVSMNYDWDWGSADREYRRAIELNAGYTKAHSLFAWCLSARGRSEEGLAEMKRALEPDPLSLYDNANLGWHLLMARRYDQAIEQLRKTLDMDPNLAEAHLSLGQVYEQKRMYEEAIAEFQEATRLFRGSAPAMASLGHAYALAGKKDEALRVLKELKELSKQKYVSAYDIAVIYAGLGKKEEAFEWLGKAYEQRDGWLAGRVKVDPRLDSLRSVPRFQDLLRRVGHAP